MNSEIFIRECSEHQLETIAVNINHNVDPSCRHCCVKCLKDPLKAQNCLPYNEARAHLDQVKKTFKWRKEVQIKNNISTLIDLDKNIVELKNMQVQIFDEIQETIKYQIQQFQNLYSNLEQKLLSIDLDQYLSNTNDLAYELTGNQEFQNKCQNLLESIFAQSNKEMFIRNLNNLDNQSILLMTEKKQEITIQPKKKTLISFKCEKHDEEMRLYDENQLTPREDRIICEECSIERKGPFRTILSIYKDWEQSKITQVQSILEVQKEQNLKLENVITLYKEYQKELESGINQIIMRIEKENAEKNDNYAFYIRKLEKDWKTLTREQIIKITEILTQPILKEKKLIKRKQKIQTKINQQDSLLKEQLTQLVQSSQKNLKIISQSINQDYQSFKIIVSDEQKSFEEISQTTQMVKSIQFKSLIKNERFSNISYINETVLKLVSIEKKLKQHKDDETLIKNYFYKINSLNCDQNIKQEKEFFREYCNKIFLIIKKQFSKYTLSKSNEEENLKKNILKFTKDDLSDQEVFLEPQEILNFELQTQQFTVIENTSIYSANFQNSIEEKLRIFDKYLIQYHKIYQFQITVKWIKKQDFENYIEKDMFGELEAYCNQDKDKEIYDTNLWIFVESFRILNIKINPVNLSLLQEVSRKWFKGDKKQKLLRQCFEFTNDQQSYTLIQKQRSYELILAYCPKFLKYLQQKETIISILENEQQLNDFISSYTNDDNLIFEFKKQVVTNKNIDEIFENSEKFCKYRLSSWSKDYYTKQQPIFDTFNYILNQKNDSNLQNKFQQNIVPLMQELLSQNNNQGWRQIFIEVHKAIFDQLKASQGSSFVENKLNIELTQFGLQQIQKLISNIEGKIKQFNLYFSNFGVIFNDVVNKSIFQYSVFVLWRYFCFDKWLKQKYMHREQQQQLDVQLLRFKADINEDIQDKSRFNGCLLAQHIFQQAIAKQYLQYSLDLHQFVNKMNNEWSSFDLIKKLDNDILLRQDKSVTDQQIVEYVTNQTNYIKKYTKQKIQNIKLNITQQFQIELIFHLRKIQNNIQHLCDYLQPQTVLDYFDQQVQPDMALELIYQMVASCLQGSIKQSLLDSINPKYRDKFQIKNLNIFSDPLCDYASLDIQIHDLYRFTLGFKSKIDIIISEVNNLNIDFERLKIQSTLETLEFTLIGCIEQCPVCKRKFDEDINAQDHIHKCKNGHQLRGIQDSIHQ